MVIDYFATEVVLAKFNAKEDTALAREYHISAFPTLVLTNSSGEEIDRIVGYLDPPEFVQKINDYRNGIGTLDDLLSRADTSSDRLLSYEIAEKYKYRGGTDEAKVWFGKVIDAGEPTDSLSGESRMALADMVRRTKDYDAAVQAFAGVMNDFQGTIFAETAEIWRAIVYRQAGDTTAAVTAFEDFIKHYPESEDIDYAKGQIDKLTGKEEVK